MAYWEFLLQKEGDRDWLPLETAHVEISEGRYRVIAHTSYCNTPITIRLSQLLTAPMPPQPKTRQRVGQTNQNGLMVVMPFTHLSPGRWTIHCRADLPTDPVSEQPREYGVQLQVLAIESGVEYWDIELDEAAIAEQLTAETTATAEEQVLPSSEPSADGMPSAPAPIANAAMAEAAQLAGTTTPLEDLPLRLQLQHQALVAQAQTDLTLQGQITTFSQLEGLASDGTLWVQMRNPETGVVVHQATQTQSMANLPSRFEMPLQLPDQLSTRLLVGELSLWLTSEPPQILAIQGFTVTLNLDALLEAVANQAERSPETVFDDAVIDSDESSPNTDGSTTLTDDKPPRKPSIAAPAPREIPFRLVYLPSTGLTLPPVIYRPLDKKVIGEPSLPPLSGNRNRSASSTPALAPPEPTTAAPTTPPTTAEAVSPAPAAPSPTVELPSFGRSRRPEPSPATPQPSATVPSPQETPPTFQPDYQSRFWTRLSALAEEAQKAAADHKAQLEAAGLELPNAPTTPSLLDEPFQSDEAINHGPPNYEVVVYESEEPDSSTTDAETATEVSVVEVLRPEDPDLEDLGTVPIPTLILPQSELVAGAPLPITIRLPAYPRRLAVKVWVTDIQSRTLVDRPRWLMNWTPAEAGEQTAFLKLQVPLGSIEATFEAIAIDLATQQESYKTTLVRAIAPANLPDIDNDDII